jgi:acyl-CoA thioesterase-1
LADARLAIEAPGGVHDGGRRSPAPRRRRSERIRRARHAPRASCRRREHHRRYGVARELSYPAQLQQELDKRGYRYRVVNHGVSGSTTSDALTRLDRGVALYPKIVIIALGGNDGGALPRGRTRDNLARMITMYKRIGAEVLLADREVRSADGQPARSMFADLAGELHAILMPPLLTGVAGHPDLLLDDGRHPTGEGYTIIVSRLIPILEPYLKR